MSSKSAVCYKSILKFIEKKVFKLEPGEFITDFELGMRSAINKIYPTVPLRGCWYHYCAALRKNFLKFGLHSLLKSNALARMIKAELMSLPLLPAEHFKEGYEFIKLSAKNWKLSNNLMEMFIYFENYWFAQVSSIEMYSNSLIFRTIKKLNIYFVRMRRTRFPLPMQICEQPHRLNR